MKKPKTTYKLDSLSISNNARKLKVPQPYASMIISGALQVLPDKWGSMYGDKIYIYADDIDESFAGGQLDYLKPLHQKVYNEMFLGNIPSETFPTHTFLGYVSVNLIGETNDYWVSPKMPKIFVSSPCEFVERIEDFHIDIPLLAKKKALPTKLQRMSIRSGILYVPVGRAMWEGLSNCPDYSEVVLFNEPYMKFYSKEEWRDIKHIKFKYMGRTLSVESIGVEPNDFVKIQGQVIKIFNFKLRYLWSRNVLEENIDFSKINVRIPDKKICSEEYARFLQELKGCDAIKEITFRIKPEKGPHTPPIRIIYTPMGGMTRRR